MLTDDKGVVGQALAVEVVQQPPDLSVRLELRRAVHQLAAGAVPGASGAVLVLRAERGRLRRLALLGAAPAVASGGVAPCLPLPRIAGAALPVAVPIALARAAQAVRWGLEAPRRAAGGLQLVAARRRRRRGPVRAGLPWRQQRSDDSSDRPSFKYSQSASAWYCAAVGRIGACEMWNHRLR